MSLRPGRKLARTPSWLVIPPPLDHEAAILIDPDVVEFVEPLVQRGPSHAARRPDDALQGHPLFSRALLIPPHAILDTGLEVVADHPEPGLAGGTDVDLPLGTGRVSVVHDERLLRLDARPQEQPLPVAGPEQVQAEADVGGEEACPVERRFP